MAGSSPKARLGRALRAIRGRMGLTLADVAARTGVSVSTLSKVENGQLSPTYDKLVRLSEGLQVDINAFFGDAADGEVLQDAGSASGALVTGRRSVARRGQGLLVETPNYDYRYLCTDLARKAMVPILITIRARSLLQVSAFSKHSGEEFIYVLRGSVEVHTEFYEPTPLRAGEGVYIDSTMFHASLTTGRASALVLNVCHSPSAGHFRTLVELARAAATHAGDGTARAAGGPPAGLAPDATPQPSPPTAVRGRSPGHPARRRVAGDADQPPAPRRVRLATKRHPSPPERDG